MAPPANKREAPQAAQRTSAVGAADETTEPFLALVARLQNGDEAATREFWRTYGRFVRRMARRCLNHAKRLRRLIDSADVEQAAMLEVWQRLVRSETAVPSPAVLLGLISEIVHHHVLKRAEHSHAARRDVRRVLDIPPEELAIADSQPSPAEQAMLRETQKEFEGSLGKFDAWLVAGRRAGRSFADLAVEAGSRPGTLRMRLARLVWRLKRKLNGAGGGSE